MAPEPSRYSTSRMRISPEPSRTGPPGVRADRSARRGFLLVDVLQVLVDDVAHFAERARLAVVEPQRVVAQVGDDAQRVRDEHDRRALAAQLEEVVEALALELLVADGDDLVDDEDLGVDGDGDGESQAARTCRWNRPSPGESMKSPMPAKSMISVHRRVDLLAGQAEDRAVEVDVLAPGQLAVEARAELEQRRDRARSRRPFPTVGR